MDDAFLTELYKDLPKLGTGSPKIIREVFSKLELRPDPTILDVGCATGMSSIELAKLSRGNIVSLDINQTFLDILEERAKAEKLSNRIKTINQNLFTMEFEEGTFDVIWAENVLFVKGIRGALKSWRRFLKEGGYIVFSVIVQLKADAPDDAMNYWERVYPAMKTPSKIEMIIKEQNCILIDTIPIPASETMTYCYIPLEKRIAEMREAYRTDKKAISYLDLNQEEIDIIRKYGSEFYGSIFYIVQS
jgi:ubiquinone/menaquinone biosynthesis C-methylase UbiE